MPFFVCMSALRTRPSLPGYTLTTRPLVQLFLSSSYAVTTKSPTSSGLTSVNHLLRLDMLGRYSLIQRFQNWLIRSWTRFQLLRNAIRSSVNGFGAELRRMNSSTGSDSASTIPGFPIPGACTLEVWN